MTKPTLSTPPTYVPDTDSSVWKKWFSKVFERVGEGAFSVQGYLVASLPPITNSGSTGTNPFSSIIFVSDESGGATIAFSDGTNWRRVTDNAIVS